MNDPTKTDTSRCPMDGKMPFCPPKPKHRAHEAGFFNRLFSRNRDMLENYTERAYSYLMGRNHMGLGIVYPINCLDSARKVLIDEAKDFPKSGVMLRALEPLVGRAVFSVSGEEWKGQRKRLNPSLSHLHVKRGFPRMRDAADHMIKRLEQKSGTDQTVDMSVEMSMVTSDVIFRVMFGENIDDKSGEDIYQLFLCYQKNQRYFSLRTLVNWPKWIPVLGQRQNKAACTAAKAIRKIIEKIIKERMAMPEDMRPPDMLTTILDEYKKDFGDRLPVTELVDQIAFFFLAGHETTAAATCWTIYLVSQDSVVEKKIVQEIEAVVGSGEISFDAVRKLKYTEAVFKEAMRLYAPVPYLPRKSLKNIVIRKHKIRPGDQCTVNPYFIHRSTRLWQDPDLFRPERFLEDDGLPDNKLAYMPFSAGPRICPGATFATVESLLIFASLYRKFTFQLQAEPPVEPFAQLTLRPKSGLPVTVRRRS